MIQKCPRCEGKGVKVRSFYPDMGQGDDWVSCRSCAGRGVLNAESAPYIPYTPPLQPVYPWRPVPPNFPPITWGVSGGTAVYAKSDGTHVVN